MSVMPFKNKDIGRKLVEKILIPAFEKTVENAFLEFRVTIESEIFYWDRITRRTNGDIVYTPRDIVDTGTFLNSQYIEKDSPTRYIIGWRAEYASTILTGQDRSDGTRMPGRNWVAKTFDRWSMGESFQDNIKKRLG